MAPTITASMINSNHLLPLTNKLRKPIVEKMRRERINSSIEKLKSLLGGEFLKQQPDSRQEKADILEMTSQRRLLSHFLTMQPSMEKSRSVVPQLSSPACQISSKEETPGCSGLWRPW
ncbi:hypothetical protein PGIGA_G00073340 [Pangasianodon gigas]|uniref:Uncharacterized protein n=1 Tax=Pangasianodon gigas TaxID=30993 RepID=A0ACC5X8B9_PANGG|nr:hypothetical protein [Pangasianodon gigas]